MVKFANISKALILASLAFSIFRLMVIPSCDILDASNIEELVVKVEQPARFFEVAEILALSQTGQEALDIIDRFNVSVTFENGKGTYFHRGENRMVIDAGKNTAAAALAIVHEAHHALYTHNDLVADAYTMSEDEYVQTLINEETDAELHSIEAALELKRAGVDMNGALLAFQERYKHSYNEAVTLESEERGIYSDDLLSVGREAGREAIYNAFMVGDAIMSNTGRTYTEVYAEDYVRLNEFALNN